MDQNFQTSFIPKRPLAEDRTERPQTVSIFLFLSSIILVASLVGAGFVYFYNTSLTNQVTQMQGDLKKAESAFEGDFIEELQTMDRRINAATEVLSNHIVVSPIFATLQQTTLKSVQYTKFGYTITGSGPAAEVDIQMSGIAASYTAVALESDALTQNKYMKDPIFSNLTLDDKGNVLFDLTFSVDPTFVLYGEALARASGTSADNNSSNVQAPQQQASQQQAPQQQAPQQQQAPLPQMPQAPQNSGAGGGVVSFPSNSGASQ